MMNCPNCKIAMNLSQLHCDQCNLNLSGNFVLPRLARLSEHNRKLAEMFLLYGGNLKIIAEIMNISYPTIRRKVDEMIEELNLLREQDKNKAEQILKDIELGKITAQEGLRIIKDLANN